jgi:aminopeptidase N
MHRSITLSYLLAGASIAAAFPAAAQSAAREVLPDTVVPSHYELAIRPDLDALTFTGTNAITVDVRKPTNDIVLNADGLTFDSVRLDTGETATAAYDQELGRATLHFASPVAPGQHVITIDYHGKIGRQTLGFFAMDYEGAAGKRRTLATNLEPTGARQVFPGWDEPAIKATYTVTVDAPADRMALSNMPVARTVALSPVTNRVTFAQSPKMSSYLFFLGIGDWERVHQTIDGVDLGVVVNRGDIDKAQYSLAEAGKLLNWYNDYFGVGYPLPKMDLIAAPGQIQGGSMENWGAIFYSQDHLLFDPQAGTEGDRQLVFLVVAHEMAHQWFGDLVTMSWWDDLWLNEGFARWMQTYVADALHPEWQTGLKAQSIFESGKAADALSSTHPIVQSIMTANQASQAFDSITYDKGAAVITMLKDETGDAAFRSGVQSYMRAHAFANTVDADFWGVMQKASGKPILAIERDFTTQPGVPLVRATATPSGLRLAEDRFTFQGPGGDASSSRWRIPLTVAPLEGKEQHLLLSNAATMPVPTPALVNAGQTAYARVLYDDVAFATLVPRLPRMAPVDQIGLLQDARALGLANYAPTSRLLALAATVPATAEPVVWERIAGMLSGLDRTYVDGPQRVAFRGFAIGVLRPALDSLGLTASPSESPNAPIARATLIETLGSFGDPQTVARAKAMIEKDSGTPAEQRSALTIAAAKASPEFFDALLARARSTNDPLVKMRIYEALAGVEDRVLARRMVDVILSDEVPAGTNVALMFPLAIAHPSLAWDFIVPRLADPKVGIEKTTQWRIAGGIAGLSSDEARIADLQKYIDQNVPEDARQPLQGSLESIRLRHRLSTQVLPEMDAWIARSAR